MHMEATRLTKLLHTRPSIRNRVTFFATQPGVQEGVCALRTRNIKF